MSLGSFELDLECAQLHLTGSGRMMMVVHVVDANEHDGRAYRACAAQVNALFVYARHRRPQ